MTAPLCPEAAYRDSLDDYDPDDPTSDEVAISTPCPECGQVGACAYDPEGRDMPTPNVRMPRPGLWSWRNLASPRRFLRSRRSRGSFRGVKVERRQPHQLHTAERTFAALGQQAQRIVRVHVRPHCNTCGSELTPRTDPGPCDACRALGHATRST